MTRILSAILTVLLFASPAFAQCDPNDIGCMSTPLQEPMRSPKAVVSKLFEKYEPLKLGVGLPSPNTLYKLSALISTDLRQRLSSARFREEAKIRETPAGDKPDLFEWDIFTGTVEGATNIKVRDALQTQDGWLVDVNYKTPSIPGDMSSSIITWSGQVKLIEQDSHWVVDNIIYENGGNMVSVLRQYTSNP